MPGVTLDYGDMLAARHLEIAPGRTKFSLEVADDPHPGFCPRVIAELGDPGVIVRTTIAIRREAGRERERRSRVWGRNTAQLQ